MTQSNRFIQESFTKRAGDADQSQPACPKCRSRNATTAAKRPSPRSYWRCLQCGEVWNPGLLMNSRPMWQR